MIGLERPKSGAIEMLVRDPSSDHAMTDQLDKVVYGGTNAIRYKVYRMHTAECFSYVANWFLTYDTVHLYCLF